jgi:ribosome-interacting GTPase 1
LPANLPPQAQALWVKAQDAKTPEEKLERLQEFLSAIPAHKGTEKLRHQVRHQVAELREELDEARRRRKGSGFSYLIEKEGAAQVCLVGLPDAGKTHLLTRLTGVSAASTDVPFETSKPQPGMLRYEDVLIQIVDTPSLSAAGGQHTARATASARNADVLVIVVDGSRPIASGLDELFAILGAHRIYLRPTVASVKVERRSTGGIQVVGQTYSGASLDEISRLLREYGVMSALVTFTGRADIADVEAAILHGSVFKPSIAVVTKLESIEAETRAHTLSELANRLKPIPVIPADAPDLVPRVGAELFRASGVIRIYTKRLNQKERSQKPMIMRRGSTVLDAVRLVHSSLISTFQYAKVWGESVKYQGSRVGLDHELKDRDIVEIHA